MAKRYFVSSFSRSAACAIGILAGLGAPACSSPERVIESLKPAAAPPAAPTAPGAGTAAPTAGGNQPTPTPRPTTTVDEETGETNSEDPPAPGSTTTNPPTTPVTPPTGTASPITDPPATTTPPTTTPPVTTNPPAGGGSTAAPACRVIGVTLKSPACDKCAKASCCPPLRACVTERDCVDLNKCMADCATQTGNAASRCQKKCATDHPTGTKLLEDLSFCIQSTCVDACMGPADDATDPDDSTDTTG